MNQHPDCPASAKTPLRALIFEDNEDDIELSMRTLRSAGFDIVSDIACTREEFAQFVRSRSYDVILSDYRMPGATGAEAYDDMKAEGADIPFILVTGSLGDEKAVECLKKGIADYVLKDRLVRLPVAIRRALEERRLLTLGQKAQEALLQSEASYRSLVERAPYGIFRIRMKDGRFQEVNPALVEMLGYDCEADVLKLDVTKDVYVEPEAIREVLREQSSEGRVWTAEVEWRRRDGNVITVELGGRQVQFGEHGPCLELIANDVTARKRAEEKIAQLNRLNLVSTRVSQAIVRIRDKSELLEEICKILVEEGRFRMVWVGLVDSDGRRIQPVAFRGHEDGFLSSIHPSAANEPAGWGPSGIAARTGEHSVCQSLETLLNSPWRDAAIERGYGSGGGFPLKLRGCAVGAITLYATQADYFDDENVALLDRLAADVSFALENLDLAAQRQLAVDELDQLFTLSHDMLCIGDLRGHVNRLNPAWEKTLGFGPGEIVLDRWTDAVHLEDQPDAQAALARLREGAEIDSLELRFLTKGGASKWFVVSATPQPCRNAVFAAMRDITERKNLEEQLRRQNLALEEQNRRVHAANRLKSEFLANMSHELRSPLNGIIGFTELLYDCRIGPLDLRQKELLGRMLKSSKHLLRLINDVLDVSRIESGRFDLRPERTRLTSLIQEVAGVLGGLAAEKNIQIEISVNPDADEVVTDPARFKQVLYNYLSNALKFTDEGGRVCARTIPAGADYFRLEVSDTGIGISPDDIGRLFTEFQQLSSGKAKSHQGTGLGLALTKRLVEAQGGTVGVESKPGEGSTFYAILPRSACYGQVEAPRILVIEDEPMECAVIKHFLSSAGCIVDPASTGSVAVAKASERYYQAITLDLLLPDASGWEILEAIRSTGKNRETPVIVLSIVEEGKGQSEARGVREFLTKPVRREELLGALDRIGIGLNSAKV